MPRWIRCAGLAWLLTVSGVAPATAQTGPWFVGFAANPDHTTVASGGALVVVAYELMVVQQGGVSVWNQTLGKPDPNPIDGRIYVDVNTYLNGLPPGLYTGTIRAFGTGGQAVSVASALFSLTGNCPGPPATSANYTASPPRVLSSTTVSVIVELSVTDCNKQIRTATVVYPPR